MTIISKLSNWKLLTVSAIAFLFIATTYGASANSELQPATFGIDHLLKLQTPSDVQIDPSGNWVAYVVQRNDEEKDKRFKQIWMTSLDGKTSLPMTASYATASKPRWNPDGSALAFIGKRGDAKDTEKTKPQVWLLSRQGGEAQQFTDVEQGVEGFAWAPDGKSMLLTIKDPEPKDDEKEKVKKSKEVRPKPWVIDRLQFKKDYVGYLDRRRTHIYLFNGKSDPVQVTSGDYDDADPQWSPDGSKIAFVSKRQGDPDFNNNGDIWLVQADATAKEHALTQVTTNPGNDHSPAWSPDSKRITYVTETEPAKLWYATEHLAVVNADGSKVRILTKKYDRMVHQPTFSANGRNIYFTAEDGGNRPLMQIAVKSGKLKTLTKGDIAVRGYDLHGKHTIAVIQSSHHAPYDVHLIKKSKQSRLTKLNDNVLAKVQLANVMRLKVAGYNGESVESFVYTPADYVKGQAYPTIFVLHGGPVSQHDSAFDGWAQLYAANGYIAVLPNPHGSTGYGHDFTYSLNKQWGVPDFADVDAIAEHLVETGISKADQLGVGGWSYGGILTNYVITKSTRFAGAVTGASEVNHRANYGHDIYQHFWEVELGLPWENIEAWESINPFNDIGKVTTPTLVMGGKEDWNVPIQNSEQLYQGLKRIGVETQLVVYPGEFHGFSRPSFIRDRYQRYLDWYKKYVKKHSGWQGQ
ncbi:MAG: dipeptidyl aminopeptidase/acylaminoacyl peptidase [Paraglaciecola sp.]